MRLREIFEDRNEEDLIATVNYLDLLRKIPSSQGESLQQQQGRYFSSLPQQQQSAAPIYR